MTATPRSPVPPVKAPGIGDAPRTPQLEPMLSDPHPSTSVYDRTERLRAHAGHDFLDAREVSQALTASGIRHVVIGGHAMAAHGRIRNTEDVDVVAVAMTDAAAVVAALRPGAHVERHAGSMGCVVSGPNQEKLADVLDYFGSHAHRLAIDTAQTVDGVQAPRQDALMAMKFEALSSATRPHDKRHQDLADLIHLVDRYHRGKDHHAEVESIATVVEADGCGDVKRGADRWRDLHAAIIARSPIAV